MSLHKLTDNFNYFFKRLNPSPSFVERAANEHLSICSLIEDSYGLANVLSPKCFLQGSYKQDTAIYTINDVDIIVLCELWQPSSSDSGGRSYSRNEIFEIIAAPLKYNCRYAGKIRYNTGSMCIKVDLGIKIEILPVVYKQGNLDPSKEPFRLYRPETQRWEDGYARYHQYMLIIKNQQNRTMGNFKPAIKVFKHLRSLYNLDAVSFHIESLLFCLPDELFYGSPSEYITRIFNYFIKFNAVDWHTSGIKTPMGERELFSENEWSYSSWIAFYGLLQLGAKCSNIAYNALNQNESIEYWQILLGEDYFPKLQ